ncbi:MFS transporter [Pseudarthrobacter sp. DSP2-3-2b1]|uniref:MFS transporter n=1 Tax=Pseudarthrobacter sp. DSP2-3-2b1 TaxID=2804661 RepID=UPI003CE72315
MISLSPAPDALRSRPQGRFARLPQLAGRSFIPLGLFARLPLAMLTVGALTLVTSATGSYAIGGTAAGAVGIGSALGAPVFGALADRWGQRPVLLVVAALNSALVLALIGAAWAAPVAGPFPSTVIAAAFLAGASCPQVGPLARVRWMALTSRGRGADRGKDLDTAMSYEGTADEVTFVLGPALVGILASMVAPWLPLALAAVLTLTLVPAFAVHPTHQAVPLSGAASRRNAARAMPGVPGAAGSPRPVRVPAAVALPVLAMVAMGTFFGSTQTALSSFSASYATAEIAGLLYAVMGLSSAAAALSVAYWSRRFTPGTRLLVSAGLMTALAVLLLVPESMTGMVAVLLVLGLPVGPAMVTIFGIGGLLAPEEKLGTVMTALASGIVAGTALGSALGGQLAQAHGHQAAFVVPAAAASALMISGFVAVVILRRRNG